MQTIKNAGPDLSWEDCEALKRECEEAASHLDDVKKKRPEEAPLYDRIQLTLGLISKALSKKD